jgi:hypothetical protein
MPRGHGKNTLKLKLGDICARLRGYLTAMVWKDKQDVDILTNMHRTAAESNFCKEHGKAQNLSFLQTTTGTCAMSTERTDG